MRIGFLPLDERPGDTRFPAQLASIAGDELLMPPEDIMCVYRTPANFNNLSGWLNDVAGKLDALVISLETLAYGGLIASRTSDEPAGKAIERLNFLRVLNRDFPELPVYAYNLITRIHNDDDNIAEPGYWETQGCQIFRYSQLLDRQLRGEEVGIQTADLRSKIPDEHLRDFMKRRLRNHTVNLTVLAMVEEDIFDLLVMGVDSASPTGLNARERRWLTRWSDWIFREDERLLIYPGANDIGLALLARAINSDKGLRPKVAVRYAIHDDASLVALYQDVPLRELVALKIQAVGAEFVPDIADADLVLAINTPEPESEPATIVQTAEVRDRRLMLEPFIEMLNGLIEAEKPILLADATFVDQSDPVLIDLMFEHMDVLRLTAYASWGTAGNTIGMVLAQGIAALSAKTDRARQQLEELVAYRLVEDWGYQQVARPELREWLEQNGGTPEVNEENIEITRMLIEEKLSDALHQIPGAGERWQITPGSIVLPWKRLYEADFRLERISS